MKHRFTRILLSAVVTTTFSVTGLLAQQLTTTGLYKHGTNSTSAGVEVPAELTDSVTVGAAMDYFVMPDPNVNPSYNAATSLTDNLASNFNWTATTGTVADKAGMGANYKTVTWANLGAQKLKVVEESVTAAGGCVDGTGTEIDIFVINKPTAAAGTAPSAPCLTGNDGSLNYTPAGTFSINFTSDVKGSRKLKVTYSIKDGAGNAIATGITRDVTETGAGTGTFTVNTVLNNYGVYTISIDSISDRISEKSKVTSTITGETFTFALNRTPKTGSIYHVPNI